MSSRSRMVNASPVSSALSLDVASANLRVPCGPSSVRRQAAIDPNASALPAGLAGSIDALIEPSGQSARAALALDRITSYYPFGDRVSSKVRPSNGVSAPLAPRVRLLSICGLRSTERWQGAITLCCERAAFQMILMLSGLESVVYA